LCDVYKNNEHNPYLRAKKYIEIEDGVCKESWVIGNKPIGESSSHGFVHDGRCRGREDSKKYAFKFITLSERETLEMFIHEVNTQQYVYKRTKYTTPIYQAFVSDRTVMFVTDFLPVSVHSYIYTIMRTEPVLTSSIILSITQIITRCRYINRDLARMGILHRDAHLKNFMFSDLSFNPSRILMIDFGKSERVNNLDNLDESALLNDDEMIILHFVEWYNRFPRHVEGIFRILRDTALPNGVESLVTYIRNGRLMEKREIEAIMSSLEDIYKVPANVDWESIQEELLQFDQAFESEETREHFHKMFASIPKPL
jgi:serine/threonine protein kinase